MIRSIVIIISLFVANLSLIHPTMADSHPMSDGVVRKVDADNGKITIKHGEIVNLDMPPMSMVFTVKDAAMIGAFSKGDKVQFVAVEENGKLYVTEIKAVN